MTCLICRANDVVRIPYLDGGWPDLDTFSGMVIELCRECGFGHAVPPPNEEQLAQFYRCHYRRRGSPYYIDFGRPVSSAGLDFRAISQLSLATMFCEFLPGDSVLDLGPGAGGTFQAARQMLEGPTLFALELSDGAALMYRRVFGATTFSSVSEFRDHSNSRAKIAVLSHSLEHYSGPSIPQLLRELRAVLAPDGVLVIEVPHDDFRSVDPAARRQTPHLSFFSRESLRRSLMNEGWDVKFIDSCCGQLPVLEHRSPPRGRVSWMMRVRKQIPDSWLPLLRASRARWHHLLATRKTEVSGQLNFVYGPGRDCLRAVAVPSDSVRRGPTSMKSTRGSASGNDRLEIRDL